MKSRQESFDPSPPAASSARQSCGDVLVVSVDGGLLVSVSGAGAAGGSGGGSELRVV